MLPFSVYNRLLNIYYMSGAITGMGNTKFKEAFPALKELQAGRETYK